MTEYEQIRECVECKVIYTVPVFTPEMVKTIGFAYWIRCVDCVDARIAQGKVAG